MLPRYRNPSIARVFVPLASPANASLLYSLAFVAAMFVVACILHRRRWFLRV